MEVNPGKERSVKDSEKTPAQGCSKMLATPDARGILINLGTAKKGQVCEEAGTLGKKERCKKRPNKKRSRRCIGGRLN